MMNMKKISINLMWMHLRQTCTPIYKKATLAFMSCTCSLTGVAHIVNITVTRALISDGIDVPKFFQIGYWPSVEMAID